MINPVPIIVDRPCGVYLPPLACGPVSDSCGRSASKHCSTTWIVVLPLEVEGNLHKREFYITSMVDPRFFVFVFVFWLGKVTLQTVWTKREFA